MSSAEQLVLFNEPPRIDVGDWVQRLDDKRIGEVIYIAIAGRACPFMTVGALYHGDVIVEYAFGLTCVCSGGAYFWTKWRRVDPEAMAALAMNAALSTGEP